MNTDEVLDYRRRLNGTTVVQMPGGLPEPTIYATHEWLDTVLVMSHQIPISDPGLLFPTQADVSWSWADTGVLVCFERPIPITHLTTSETLTDGTVLPVDPVLETMQCESMIFTCEFPSPVVHEYADGTSVVMEAKALTTGCIFVSNYTALPAPVAYILSTSHVSFGHEVKANPDFGLSHSNRFLYAVLWALNHRMTTSTAMVPANNYARKRYQRSGLPPVRTLTLTAPEPTDTDGERVVNWKRSWKVRTHWRNQACGPKMRQHKKILIHSYWKQDHLPPDLRPTVWRTDA